MCLIPAPFAWEERFGGIFTGMRILACICLAKTFTDKSSGSEGESGKSSYAGKYQLKTKIILLIILEECKKHLHGTVTIKC